jgi:hypothetical protein
MASPDGNAPPPSGALTEYAGHRVPVPGWPPGWSQRLLTGGVRSLLGSGPGIPALRAATVSRGARGLRFVCGIAAAFGGGVHRCAARRSGPRGSVCGMADRWVGHTAGHACGRRSRLVELRLVGDVMRRIGGTQCGRPAALGVDLSDHWAGRLGCRYGVVDLVSAGLGNGRDSSPVAGDGRTAAADRGRCGVGIVSRRIRRSVSDASGARRGDC